MKKSELKQLIREVIEEMSGKNPDTEVTVNLAKLGKGMTGTIDVPVNYEHGRISYSPPERQTWDSPGADEVFEFDVEYFAHEDVYADDENTELIFKAGEKIPLAAIDSSSQERVENDIIDSYKDSGY